MGFGSRRDLWMVTFGSHRDPSFRSFRPRLAAGEAQHHCPCPSAGATRLGIEGRETHEQDKSYGTRKGEWQMEAKKAITPVAAAAAKRLTRRLIRRSGGWLYTPGRAHADVLLSCAA